MTTYFVVRILLTYPLSQTDSPFYLLPSHLHQCLCPLSSGTLYMDTNGNTVSDCANVTMELPIVTFPTPFLKVLTQEVIHYRLL